MFASDTCAVENSWNLSHLSSSTLNRFGPRSTQGQDIKQIPVMLVGNKCDEQSLREVTDVDGKAESVSWGVSFMETSAKNNTNVTELFQVKLR